MTISVVLSGLKVAARHFSSDNETGRRFLRSSKRAKGSRFFRVHETSEETVTLSLTEAEFSLTEAKYKGWRSTSCTSQTCLCSPSTLAA